MTTRKAGLGRNLEALLGNSAKIKAVSSKAPPAGEALVEMDVNQLQAGQYQPRQTFFDDTLDELAQSIKKQGVIQPLVVRALDHDKYEIIAGERRWRAAQLAELSTVPVVIKAINDHDAMAIALIENLQREDLNPVDQAIALQRLQKAYELSQQQLAELVGKSRSTLSNLLRILNLHQEVRSMLEQGDIEMGHAKVLLSLRDDEQLATARLIILRSMSVRDTERYVHNIHDAVDNSVDNSVDNVPTSRQMNDKFSAQLKLAGTRLDSRIKIKHSNKGNGKLVLNYKDEAALEKLLASIA